MLVEDERSKVIILLWLLDHGGIGERMAIL